MIKCKSNCSHREDKLCCYDCEKRDNCQNACSCKNNLPEIMKQQCYEVIEEEVKNE